MTNDERRARHVLRPVNGGYKIERLRWDEEFEWWTSAGFLNGGGRFPTREAATEYMVSRVER